MKGEKIMNDKKWDMYTYILESKQAVRNIVENQEKIFQIIFLLVNERLRMRSLFS